MRRRVGDKNSEKRFGEGEEGFSNLKKYGSGVGTLRENIGYDGKFEKNRRK